MTIEEALAASEAEPVTDDDMQFWVDEHLRVISIPKNGVVAGVEGDKNVNKIKFRMNRYYHGFDMSEFSGRILYLNAKGNKNYYNITDMQESGSTITFSWLVDADAVQYMGKTAFVVYLFKTQGSELRQKFYSTLATLNVLEGMEVDSAVPVEKQTDIIERMKEEISAYAEEVKKSLPADYTAMTEQVSSLKEDIDKLNEGGLNLKDEIIAEDINNWLNEHPEATTTVQDGAITESKIHSDFLPYIKNEYITPEMFGAVGDGVTDDTEAIYKAIEYLKKKYFGINTLCLCGEYFVNDTISIPSRIKIRSNGYSKIVTNMNKPLIRIYYDNTQLYDRISMYSWSPIIDGNNGLCLINSNNESNSVGIYIDSRETDKGDISRYLIQNIQISGFYDAVRSNDMHTFCMYFNNCCFEGCIYGVRFIHPTNEPASSGFGENMMFNRCIFAGHKACIVFDTLGPDISFTNCSFDYNQVIFSESKDLQGYRRLYINGGHIEALGYYSFSGREINYNGLLSNDTSFYTTILSIENVKFVLYEGYSKLFYSNCLADIYFSVTNIISILPNSGNNNQLVDNLFLSDVAIDGANSYYSECTKLPYKDGNLLKNSLFEDLNDDSNLSDSSAYSVFYSNNVTSVIEKGSPYDENGHHLKLTSTGADSNCTLECNMNLQGNSWYLIVPCGKGNMITGETNITYYDENNTQISSQTLWNGSKNYTDDNWHYGSAYMFKTPVRCKSVKYRFGVTIRNDLAIFGGLLIEKIK